MMQTSFRVGLETVTVKENLMDRVISAIDPVRGKNRFQARCSMALATGGGGYKGGKRKSRTMSGFGTTDNDADGDLLPDLAALRETSRSLTRNTPIAAGAVNTAVTNVVGAGLKLHSMIDRDYLNLDDEAADKLEEDFEREFNLWAIKPENCDAASTLNFYGHQNMAFRSMLENGDVFYLLPMKERAGSSYKLKLKAIEADRVCNEDNKQDAAELAGGIKLDSDGAPTAYHIAKKHPGAYYRNANEWNVIPAFGEKSGRRNVLHLFEQNRPGQRRGAPFLAPVIEALTQLGRYSDAELMAAVVSGMFTVFIHSESELENDDGTPVASGEDLEMGNGKIVYLDRDEKVDTANPGRPNAGFDPFVMSILRQIGSALEIPYELLIKHFTASYSASRAAIMEAWKMFKKRRQFIADYFCNPVYEAVITEAVIAGRLYAPGFLENSRIRAAYLGAVWVGPGKGQIQEKQEVEAAEKRVQAGFSTRAQETAEMNGGDWSRNHRQLKKEQKARVDDGLVEPFPKIVASNEVTVVDPEA